MVIARGFIYSDLAYTGSFGIIGLYQHASGWHALPPNEYAINVALSLVWILVEHAFGHVVNN
jgi:hypothetical protein